MGSGPTAGATGTTTGRITGTRANSGRRACTTRTSKPTSSTCWPKPARSRSTEATEPGLAAILPAQPLGAGARSLFGHQPSNQEQRRAKVWTNHTAVQRVPAVLRQSRDWGAGQGLAPISSATGRSFCFSQPIMRLENFRRWDPSPPINGLRRRAAAAQSPLPSAFG